MAVTLDDIRAARDHLAPLVRNTPLKRSSSLSDRTGGDVHLKLENFQRTGSFKVRGALWKIHNLTAAERDAGVVAASAGIASVRDRSTLVKEVAVGQAIRDVRLGDV